MPRICVYCGSNAGFRPDYADAAKALGAAIARSGQGVVYGGAHVGLMGMVADAALAEGGEVIGILPESLRAKELAHDGLTSLEIVASMHARKNRMADLSDGFVALPGGIGTLEEIFEVWTWAQLGDHSKPCGLLNVAGYYDRLCAFLDHQAEEGFIKPELRATLIVEAEPEALLERFAAYEAPVVEKWIGRKER